MITYSVRLNECLADASIDRHVLLSFVLRSLKERPKHSTLKEAIHYRMEVIQAERLALLLAP